MFDLDDFPVADTIVGICRTLGLFFRWLFFLGQKKIADLRKSSTINALIGFPIFIFLVVYFFRQVLIFVRYLL